MTYNTAYAHIDRTLAYGGHPMVTEAIELGLQPLALQDMDTFAPTLRIGDRLVGFFEYTIVGFQEHFFVCRVNGKDGFHTVAIYHVNEFVHCKVRRCLGGI